LDDPLQTYEERVAGPVRQHEAVALADPGVGNPPGHGLEQGQVAAEADLEELIGDVGTPVPPPRSAAAGS
jgi:hypothetical protein